MCAFEIDFRLANTSLPSPPLPVPPYGVPIWNVLAWDKTLGLGTGTGNLPNLLAQPVALGRYLLVPSSLSMEYCFSLVPCRLPSRILHTPYYVQSSIASLYRCPSLLTPAPHQTGLLFLYPVYKAWHKITKLCCPLSLVNVIDNPHTLPARPSSGTRHILHMAAAQNVFSLW